MMTSKRKNILVLGAGRVSLTLLEHLYGLGHRLTVADADLEQAQQRLAQLGGEGEAVQILLTATTTPASLAPFLHEADLVVNLLPPQFDELVIQACIEGGVSVVSASYVTPEIQAMEPAMVEAGIIYLAEMGLDPGIDHLLAVKMITATHVAGGQIDKFASYCGGLPAPEAADNPLQYKFTWSPRGVVQATCRPARYRQEGVDTEFEAEVLYGKPPTITLAGYDIPFEIYPNRDSVPYIQRYDVPEVKHFIRGTLRYDGWGSLWNGLRQLGWLDKTMQVDKLPTTAVEIGAVLDRPTSDPLVQGLAWIFADVVLPESQVIAPVDLLTDILPQKEALNFRSGEEDVVVMLNELIYHMPASGEAYRWTITMDARGVPNGGNSAMAQTTGYTAAIGAELLAEGVINGRGIVVPTSLALADLVLPKLAEKGITFNETKELIKE
ncbi:MAG TPA: saccharopine dehydrogenase C-terminal domain-containing protein [Anaerolineae bacterium]|nr:saccharopine dehydrogenase C-terminal domain-containing protein [Anaerolineae bacterium]